MDLFPLQIFPEGSLRESVVTTVWVGVLVISFFNLRFGWTYSGLVVPGYLVPLMLTNPVCAGITIAEGILAYCIVWFVSEYLSRFGLWCSFFGRDRFFALFVSAVFVRVTMDGWLLPQFAEWLQTQWSFTLDYKDSFRSFGMIITALIANQFWKTGLWRGLPPFALSLCITFVLIRYVLMTVTNFSVGHLAYMYSDVAASLLASPKSYIILIVTGFVASRMNLRYGLDYNGILIPALLALQWYEPLKILSTLAEAAVAYTVSDLLLRTPFFRGMTMEGARKVLLFFNVAYAYRFCLGYILPAISPDIAVNDYFGFAYLLSSLIALKMHSKHIVLRLGRATLQTSFVAAVAANLLGLWLATLLGSVPMAPRKPPVTTSLLRASAETVEALVAKEKLRLYSKRAPESVLMPTPSELNRFREALQLIQQHVDTGAREPLELARIYLEKLNYAVELVESRHLCLHERAVNRGWGIYVIDLNRPNGLVMETPAPLDEWSVVESAIRLYRRLGASALAIAGGSRFANKDRSADVLANRNTPFHVFHQVFGRRNVLQVRGTTIEAVRQLPSLASSNMLFVKAELPRSLSLKGLQGEIGDFAVNWRPLRLPNVQQRQTRSGFAELWLTRPTRIQLKSRLAESFGSMGESAVPREGLILEWLVEQKRQIAKGGSNAYIPPLPEELLFFDEEILTPLMEVADTGYANARLTAGAMDLIRAINCSGWLVGYHLCMMHDPSVNQDFLVLAESPDATPRRYWGTYVVRLGERRPYIVQVPRPLFDLNTLEFGVHLFDRLQAESILLAGSHNEANPYRTSDVLDIRNAASLFSLVNQVALRQAHAHPKMVIQCRGYACAPDTVDPPEILVAAQDGIRDKAMLGALGQTLLDCLEADGFRIQFVDGSALAAGYEISCVPQAQYINQSMNKEFAVLWLSPTFRDAFRPQEDYPLRVQLEAAGISIAQDDLKGLLKERLASGRKTVIPPELRDLLLNYVKTTDVVLLIKAVNAWPQFNYSAVLDRTSRQLFLLIGTDSEALPVVLNIRPRQVQIAAETGTDLERLDRFLRSRSPVLEWSQ